MDMETVLQKARSAAVDNMGKHVMGDYQRRMNIGNVVLIIDKKTMVFELISKNQ